jgi:hypothetical protein
VTAHVGLAFHDTAVLRLFVEHGLVFVREHDVGVESLNREKELIIVDIITNPSAVFLRIHMPDLL